VGALVLPMYFALHPCEGVCRALSAVCSSFAHAHVHSLKPVGEGMTPKLDTLGRVLLMAWTTSTLRLSHMADLAVVVDNALPRRTFSEVALLMEWTPAAEPTSDRMRKATLMPGSTDRFMTWFLGLGDSTVVGEVYSQERMDELVHRAKVGQVWAAPLECVQLSVKMLPRVAVPCWW
jgi:hypothetical protein